MKAYTKLAPIVALAMLTAACGGEDGASGSADDVVNGPSADGPLGPDGKPLPLKLDGQYELATVFDLTTAGLFPDAASSTLKALSNFREKPTKTLVDLLAVANVPIVPQLLGILPPAFRDSLLGFIDDYLVKSLYNAVPFAQTMTGLLDDLASITTNFELVTLLDTPVANPVGDAQATHAFTAIAWNFQGKRTVIQAPDVVQQALQVPGVTTNAVPLEKRGPEIETARLRLGTHRFTVPFGSFAVAAADKLAQEKFGAKNLRDAVGRMVNCEAMADTVSKVCIDSVGPGRVCIDHKADLLKMCTTSLDVLVASLQQGIKKLDLPLLAFQEGSAQMWDAPIPNGPLDATIDRIDKGFWTAKATVGKTEKPMLMTFSGKRVGDSKLPGAPKPASPR